MAYSAYRVFLEDTFRTPRVNFAGADLASREAVQHFAFSWKKTFNIVVFHIIDSNEDQNDIVLIKMVFSNQVFSKSKDILNQ